jgi:5-methylcytosine-specific restriction protein A
MSPFLIAINAFLLVCVLIVSLCLLRVVLDLKRKVRQKLGESDREFVLPPLSTIVPAAEMDDNHVFDVEPAYGTRRSGEWSRVRDDHIKEHPVCEVCGGRDNLNVHHVEPYHLHPEKELDPTNLITLCEAPGHNCHFIFGHLLNWRSFNSHVREDAAIWREKIHTRPSGSAAA